MSSSVEGVSNNAYEYLFLARSGARSQSDLDELDTKPSRQQLRHGRSVDTYVEMNTVFSMAPEEIDGDLPSEEDIRQESIKSKLRHGKSVDAYVEMNAAFTMGPEEIDQDSKERKEKLRLGRSVDSYVDMGATFTVASEEIDVDSDKSKEPVAITAVYENMVVKAQNPRRKLRRNHDDYEPFDFHDSVIVTSSSAPENYVSNAFLSIKNSQEDLTNSCNENGKEVKKKVVKLIHIPLSPTHYNQPPTPDHPPPSAIQAEKSIVDRIRPLSQVSI